MITCSNVEQPLKFVTSHSQLMVIYYGCSWFADLHKFPVQHDDPCNKAICRKWVDPDQNWGSRSVRNCGGNLTSWWQIGILGLAMHTFYKVLRGLVLSQCLLWKTTGWSSMNSWSVVPTASNPPCSYVNLITMKAANLKIRDRSLALELWNHSISVKCMHLHMQYVGWWSPTVIRGDEREAVHIPNHKFSVSVVRNLTQKTHWRIKTHIGISHLDVNKISVSSPI